MAGQTSEWQHRRSKFNHDWLKNVYLNNLDGFLAIFRSSKPDKTLVKEFLEEDFPQWKEKMKEGEWLLDSFEETMSPKTFFEKLPLSRMKNNDKKWATELIHANWMARHSIEEKIAQSKKCLKKANEDYTALDGKLKQIERNPSELKNILPEFKNFRASCLAFSRSLSKFPRKTI